MNKTSMYAFVVIMIGASLLAACGQAPDTSANPSAPAVAPLGQVPTAIPQSANANTAASGGHCAVLSKDEVGTILGEAVVDLRDPAKDGSLCVYQTQTLILELNTQRVFGGFGDSVNFMQQIRANDVASGDTPLEVPGLGDEAFYHGGSGFIRVLLVRKGAIVYSFGIRNITTDQSLSSPANAQAMEKALADLILTRVP